MKKYTPLDATFSNITVAVGDVFVHSFQSLKHTHFDKLHAHAPFQIPSSSVLDYSLLYDQDVSTKDGPSVTPPTATCPATPTDSTLVLPTVLPLPTQDLHCIKNVLVPGPLAPPAMKKKRTKHSEPSTQILPRDSTPNCSPNIRIRGRTLMMPCPDGSVCVIDSSLFPI